ncbi:protein ORF18 [Anguillid herpesvirus 1]|uniref:Protein ORF18 n=1 Tax=Anguillid herpesvirus 1 TaxID=150286 RepID=A0A8E5EW38_9VIRU|nr:protein ORF18 [Anguillid herpesvirus 1]ADA57781.2 protein ORF18 [Anguillid herpesvirus 1]QRM16313.1 protein ORF18 [Anguillid herpesvirus 1]QRM16572.1 protein ORF18 [Anguillid herpesvirus 1]QRM16705.1 protein ORF18 [Anguillid herpesvirus 1]QRM16836.1 protein ORF18 [Anguillid herpesvirus 1]
MIEVITVSSLSPIVENSSGSMMAENVGDWPDDLYKRLTPVTVAYRGTHKPIFNEPDYDLTLDETEMQKTAPQGWCKDDVNGSTVRIWFDAWLQTHRPKDMLISWGPSVNKAAFSTENNRWWCNEPGPLHLREGPDFKVLWVKTDVLPGVKRPIAEIVESDRLIVVSAPTATTAAAVLLTLMKARALVNMFVPDRELAMAMIAISQDEPMTLITTPTGEEYWTSFAIDTFGQCKRLNVQPSQPTRFIQPFIEERTVLNGTAAPQNVWRHEWGYDPRDDPHYPPLKHHRGTMTWLHRPVCYKTTFENKVDGSFHPYDIRVGPVHINRVIPVTVDVWDRGPILISANWYRSDADGGPEGPPEPPQPFTTVEEDLLVSAGHGLPNQTTELDMERTFKSHEVGRIALFACPVFIPQRWSYSIYLDCVRNDEDETDTLIDAGVAHVQPSGTTVLIQQNDPSGIIFAAGVIDAIQREKELTSVKLSPFLLKYAPLFVAVGAVWEWKGVSFLIETRDFNRNPDVAADMLQMVTLPVSVASRRATATEGVGIDSEASLSQLHREQTVESVLRKHFLNAEVHTDPYSDLGLQFERECLPHDPLVERSTWCVLQPILKRRRTTVVNPVRTGPIANDTDTVTLHHGQLFYGNDENRDRLISLYLEPVPHPPLDRLYAFVKPRKYKAGPINYTMLEAQHPKQPYPTIQQSLVMRRPEPCPLSLQQGGRSAADLVQLFRRDEWGKPATPRDASEWCASNRWCGVLACSEWSPENLGTFYFEPDRLWKQIFSEKTLTGFQERMMTRPNNELLFEPLMLGLIISMCRLTDSILELWAGCMNRHYTEFVPQKASQSVNPQYNLKRRPADKEPFHTVRDFLDWAEECEPPEWVQDCPPITAHVAQATTKKFPHIVNELIKRGYADHHGTYSYYAIPNDDWLLLGAFVSIKLHRSSWASLPDFQHLIKCADRLLNNPSMIEPVPPYLLYDPVREGLNHHPCSAIECAVRLLATQCSWLKTGVGEYALVYFSDSAISYPDSVKKTPENLRASELRIFVTVLLGCADRLKMEAQEQELAVRVEPVLRRAYERYTFDPTLRTIIPDLLSLTDEDVWRLVGMFIAPIALYRLVPRSEVTLPTDGPCGGFIYKLVDRIRPLQPITQLVFLRSDGLKETVKIVTDVGGPNDAATIVLTAGEVTTKTVRLLAKPPTVTQPSIPPPPQKTTTLSWTNWWLYKPDIFRPVYLPSLWEPRLSVKWKTPTRLCVVKYWEKDRDKVWTLSLPDHITEFLHHATVLNARFKLEWTFNSVELQPGPREPVSVQRWAADHAPGHPLVYPFALTVSSHSIKLNKLDRTYTTSETTEGVQLAAYAKWHETQTLPFGPEMDSEEELGKLLAIKFSAAPDEVKQAYLNRFRSKVIFEANAMRHMFTTILLRPYESLGQIRAELHNVIPSMGRWLLVSLTPLANTFTHARWTVTTDPRNLTQVEIACRHSAWKPLLLNVCLGINKFCPLPLNEPGLLVIRLPDPQLLNETLEACLILNCALNPAWRTFMIQTPTSEGVEISRSFLEKLPFIREVRTLEPANEFTWSIAIDDAARKFPIFYPRLRTDQNADTGGEGNGTGEEMEVTWTVYDPTTIRKPDFNRSIVVQYKPENKWVLGALKAAFNKDKSQRRCLFFQGYDSGKVTRLPDRTTIANGHIEVIPFWIHLQPDMDDLFKFQFGGEGIQVNVRGVTRLGPTTLRFDQKPDYASFFSPKYAIPGKESELGWRVIDLASKDGHDFFFTLDAGREHLDTMEWKLTGANVAGRFVGRDSRTWDHQYTAVKARAIVTAEPDKWGWLTVAEAAELNPVFFCRALHGGWTNPVWDDMARGKTAKTVIELMLPFIEMLQRSWPGGTHSFEKSVYYEKLSIPKRRTSPASVISLDRVTMHPVDVYIVIKPYPEEPVPPHRPREELVFRMTEGVPLFLVTQDMVVQALVRCFAMTLFDIAISEVPGCDDWDQGINPQTGEHVLNDHIRSAESIIGCTFTHISLNVSANDELSRAVTPSLTVWQQYDPHSGLSVEHVRTLQSIRDRHNQRNELI